MSDEEDFELSEGVKKIIEDAKTCKICLNCKFSYITDETGFGFCYYEGPGRSPSLILKPISENYVCENWKKRLKKRNGFNL